MNLYHHPAPGLEAPAGWFHVPTTRTTDRGTPLVASRSGAFPNRVLYRPSLKELIPGSFPVPQNPVMAALNKGVGYLAPAAFTVPQNPITAGIGMGRLGCGGFGCPGMGDLSTMFTTSTGGTNWLLLAALAAGGYFLFFSGKKKTGRTTAAPPAAVAQNRRRRNIEQGFYDKQGRFHPIRASADYDPADVGESLGERRGKRKRGWRY